jgi:hypothetical protein
MTSEPTMAIGRSRPGRRASSPVVETASKPMCGVRVRVGRAGDRDCRGQLGVGQGREHAGDAGQQERHDDRGARLPDRLADDDEDPGADDRAQAERRHVQGADGAPQAAVLVGGERLGRLAGEEPRARGDRHLARRIPRRTPT